MGKITFEYAGGKLEFEKDDKLILEILAAHRKQLITEQSITAAELEVSIIKRRVEQENCMIGDCQVRGRFRCGKDCGRYKSPDQSKGVGYCPCGKKPYKSAKYLGMDIWEICSCGACVLIDAALKEQFKQARTEIENGECITLKTDEDVRKYIETLGSR